MNYLIVALAIMLGLAGCAHDDGASRDYLILKQLDR